MDFKSGYYYLTISGQLKFKPEDEVKDPIQMFDDPFVQKFWRIQQESDYIAMIIEVEHTVYSSIINQRSIRAGAYHD